jgi:hypothetical protein
MAIDYDELADAGGIPKGENHWVRGRKRRAAVAAAEERNKTTVRKRDGRCRWPDCANCRTYKPALHVAHVCGAKGMGGDHGELSQPAQMMVLDAVTHQEQEQHRRDVVPVNAIEGTNGPCEFWAKDAEKRWYLVAREVAPFVYERD